MAKIIFTGWVEGLQKVSITMLLRNEAGFALDAAKHIADEILDGKIVTIDIADLEDAKVLANKAKNLGVVCEVLED